MNRSPLVSVIIPTFNGAGFIRTALRSVLEQTYRHLEALVIDDGSSDGTEGVVGCIAHEDNRVRYIRLTENSGRPAVPRNRGIAEARGDLVAFLDVDDWWVTEKLHDQVAVLNVEQDLLLVYSMVRNMGGDGPRFEVSPLPWRAALSREDLEGGKTIPCLSVLTRLPALRALGGFDEDPELKAIEDYDLWLRCCDCGPIGFIPRVHGYYRVHSGGISQDIEARNRRVRYLLEKRKMRRAPSVLGGRRPSFLWNQLRTMVHLGVLAWVKSEERLARVLTKTTPVYRSVDMSRCPQRAAQSPRH